MFLGSQHVDSPYVEIGAAATAFYFARFLVVVPVVGIIENTLMAFELSKRMIPKYLARYILLSLANIGMFSFLTLFHASY